MERHFILKLYLGTSREREGWNEGQREGDEGYRKQVTLGGKGDKRGGTQSTSKGGGKKRQRETRGEYRQKGARRKWKRQKEGVKIKGRRNGLGGNAFVVVAVVWVRDAQGP